MDCVNPRLSYCNDLDIKLVFSAFKMGKLFCVKDPIPDRLRSRVVISLHVRAVMPVISAKLPGIFPYASVSTRMEVMIRPLTFSNTYRILSIVALCVQFPCFRSRSYVFNLRY